MNNAGMSVSPIRAIAPTLSPICGWPRVARGRVGGAWSGKGECDRHERAIIDPGITLRVRAATGETARRQGLWGGNYSRAQAGQLLYNPD